MPLHNDRKRWLSSAISKYNQTNWPCPTCNTGELKAHNNWAFKLMDAKSRNESPAYLQMNPESETGHFAGVLVCTNQKCGESVTVSGNYGIELSHDFPELQLHAFHVYEPLFFNPPLHLFPLSIHCPNIIRKQIIKSFSHFFNDLAACANGIRSALELIMDDRKVPRTFVNSQHSRKANTLHKRIEKFGQNNTSLKPFLLAAKWIGNAGSHAAELTKEDLLDGYELLEHTIDELYDKKERIKALSGKARKIIQRKKPIGAKKKK